MIITEENFHKIDPNLLLDASHFRQIEDVILSVIAAGSPDYAKEMMFVLGDKLENVAEQLTSELQNRYITLLRVLKLLALRTLSDTDKEKFFSEDVLDIFKFGYIDGQELISVIFKSYNEARDIVETYRKIFLRGLESNKQTLGKQNIKLISAGDAPVAPSIKNWLTDYNSTAHVSSQTHTRSGFEQASYITAAKNVSGLSKEEKDILLKILRLYDWLRFSPLKYSFALPGQQPLQDEYVNVEKEQKYIPDEFIELIERRREKVPTGQPKLNPAPPQVRRPAPSAPKPAPLPARPQGLSPRELISELRTETPQRENVPPPARTAPALVVKKTLPPPPRPPVKPAPFMTPPPMQRVSQPKMVVPSPRPPTPQPAKTSDALYKSTLDELHKMREEEQSFSVNAAVARASKDEGGQVISGDNGVEKKLHDLENKLEEDER